MAAVTRSPQHDGSAPHRYYQIYISGEHLFARGGEGQVLPIGVVESRQGGLAYSLTIENLRGDGFLTAEKLLQDVVAKLAYAPLSRLFVAQGRSWGNTFGQEEDLSVYAEIEEPGSYPPAGSAAGQEK